MTALTDTHCHLDFHAFDDDRAAVLRRGREAGITRFLNPGIDLPTSRAALRLAQAEADVFVAVGLHPNSAAQAPSGWLDDLRNLAAAPKVVAIGEIGLDYYRDYTPPSLQQQAFARQLDLAADLGLPVVIHSRNAGKEDEQAVQDVLTLLEAWQERWRPRRPSLEGRWGVLHSFSASLPLAQQAIAMGFYIGITGPVTFKNAPDLQEVVRALPLEKVLIETDAPFLSPHPHRGKRNEPARVRLTAEKIAALHEVSVDTVARITTENAAHLFGW
ncbi:MAG: TatD family deoxyribonuclease [Anaerolineae bacterium]|nr:MAG: TatD family deoxyribonuclease [Anaerolineae bacterium]